MRSLEVTRGDEEENGECVRHWYQRLRDRVDQNAKSRELPEKSHNLENLDKAQNVQARNFHARYYTQNRDDNYYPVEDGPAIIHELGVPRPKHVEE